MPLFPMLVAYAAFLGWLGLFNAYADRPAPQPKGDDR